MQAMLRNTLLLFTNHPYPHLFSTLIGMSMVALSVAQTGVLHAQESGDNAPVASSPQARFTVKSYQLEGNTILTPSSVLRAVSDYIGPNKTLDDVNKAASSLREAYADAGYPVVQVFPPQQAPQDGIIELRIIEGKVRAITVSGNRFHDEENILKSLPRIKQGEMLNIRQSAVDLALANENSSKQVSLNLQAGDRPGDIIAKLDVQDENPRQWNLSLNNDGGNNTGNRRLTLGYQHANLFNSDHVFAANISSSLEYPHKSQSLSLSYRIPFYSLGVSLDTFASYSDSDSGTISNPNGTFAFTGEGSTFGLRVNQPLTSHGVYRHRLSYGYDFKDIKNACTSNNVQLSEKECGTITSQPLSLTYSGQYNQQSWQLSGSLGYYGNIPTQPNGSSDDYRFASDGSPTFRRAHWSLWRGNLRLNIPIADWAVRLEASGQYTNDHLISSEQIGAGGIYSLRGYVERSITGDVGHHGSAQLISGNYGSWLGVDGAILRFVAFYDYANMENNFARETSIVQEQKLHSAGVGFRIHLGNNFQLRVDNGVALKDYQSTTAGSSRKTNDNFVHAVLNYSF